MKCNVRKTQKKVNEIKRDEDRAYGKKGYSWNIIAVGSETAGWRNIEKKELIFRLREKRWNRNLWNDMIDLP